MRPARQALLTVALLLTAVALVACGDKKASEEKAETINGDGFSVAMPGKAERSQTSAPSAVGPVPVTAYISQTGSEGFSISVAKLPSGTKGNLDGAVQGAASHTGGTATDTSKTTYQGFEARDARITRATDKYGRKGTLFVRVIIAKGKLIQLQFVKEGANVKSAPESYKTFLASLKIS
jgi:hypothetical protein